MKKTSEFQESLGDDVNRNVENAVGFIKSRLGVALLAGLFFVLVLIVMIGSGGTSSSGGDTEKKLADIISKMEGVESATVMITYEDSSNKLLTSTTGSSRETSDSLNIRNSSEFYTGILENSKDVSEPEYEVRGVIVVAKGADDYMVRINIINAVTTGLNIPAEKVEVLCMK